MEFIFDFRAVRYREAQGREERGYLVIGLGNGVERTYRRRDTRERIIDAAFAGLSLFFGELPLYSPVAALEFSA